MQNDELEESVAVDTMVAKVMSRAAQPLGHLTTRMNALISKKLDDKSNPLGPHALCDYFIEASSSPGVQIKVKLIIFKLFEKHVLGDIDQLYAEANQTPGGCRHPARTPVCAARRQQRPGGPAASHTSPATHSQPVHVDEGLQEAAFSALHNLLSDLRGSSVLPARNVPSDAIPISSGDLLRLLSHMQTRAPQTVDDFDLQEQLGSLLSRVSAKTGKSRVVGEIDDDVINLSPCCSSSFSTTVPCRILSRL